MKKTIRIICFALALVFLSQILPQETVYAKSAKLGAPDHFTACVDALVYELAWSPVKGAKGYYIYRKINDGKFDKIDSTTKTDYGDSDDFRVGDNVSYFVRAYTKKKGKEILGKKSKVISFVYTEDYKQNDKLDIIEDYIKKNGESVTPVYTYVGETINENTKAEYLYNSGHQTFYVNYDVIDEKTGKNWFYSVIVPKDSDPFFRCILYDDQVNEVSRVAFAFSSLSLTKGYVFNKDYAYLGYDDKEGCTDKLNENIDTVMNCVKAFCDKVGGITLSDLGFENYK